jgi:hypothetical protein
MTSQISLDSYNEPQKIYKLLECVQGRNNWYGTYVHREIPIAFTFDFIAELQKKLHQAAYPLAVAELEAFSKEEQKDDNNNDDEDNDANKSESLDIILRSRDSILNKVETYFIKQQCNKYVQR